MGRGGHDAMVYCSHLQLAVTTGRSPVATLPLDPFPPEAVVPIGLSPPCDLPLPPCPIISSLLPFPFPWSVVPTGPPDLPGFTSLCRVHIEEGNCLRRWPGASKRHPKPAVRYLSPTAAGGPWDVPLRGLFPRRGHITTSCLQIPALSPPFGERST